MDNPTSSDGKFSDRLSAALGAYAEGKTEVDGEPVREILVAAQDRLKALLENTDLMEAITAEEQLRRTEEALLEIAERNKAA
jgi:hypothetical protein